MLELLERCRVEAPADLWKRIGSTAVFALADIEHGVPLREEFSGETFDAWHRDWEGDNAKYLLKVRMQGDKEGPASLFVSDSRTTGEAPTYTQYIFSTLPFATEDSGYLASLPGIVDPHNPEETQDKLQEGVAMGTAFCAKDEVGRLLDMLSMGTVYTSFPE